MKKILVIFGAVLCVSNANATLPVIDFSALIQLSSQLQQLEKQYMLMKNAYTTARSQLDNAKNQLDNIKSLKKSNVGSYGWGEMINSIRDLQRRQWSPGTWDDALKNIAGGNASRYQELVEAYERDHRVLSRTDYEKGATQEKGKRFEEAKSYNRAVSVQSTYVFNEINQHLQNVYELSKKIENTDNTKSALDLNSRLLAEIAYLQTENLKMQTLMNQSAVQLSAKEISNESEGAVFNTLPDE